MTNVNKFYKNLSPWIAFIGGIIVLVTSIIGTTFWIDSRISKYVKNRLEPYEHLIQGERLVNEYNYDEAIQPLEMAFSKFDLNELSKSMLYSLLKNYLSAISNSKNPTDYHSDFEKIKPYIEKHLLNAKIYHDKGLYYLRTSRLKEARDNLKLALDQYGNDERKAEGDVHWALAIVALAEGNETEAVNKTMAAMQSYGWIEEIDPESGTLLNNSLYEKLDSIYPKLSTNMASWRKMVRIKETKSREESDKSKSEQYEW